MSVFIFGITVFIVFLPVFITASFTFDLVKKHNKLCDLHYELSKKHNMLAERFKDATDSVDSGNPED